ncbi:phage tail sheath family protein [Massilia sp. TWP1-3-3]|uniref:phage tail sheath family protein n=1 Tax=Massilia sp. TWP1-3-3 TaxID=2804573 RepID=UPI003CF12F91
MPSALTYPGVYLEEVSSGVRSITGVATSVAAFAGAAERGPVNSPVHLFSYSDYERRFGALVEEFELGYSVRQFFQNGGTDAWVVRVVKSASRAEITLQSAAPLNVLKASAIDQGSDGNGIEVQVDYFTSNPGSTFNLTLLRTSDGLVERYAELSMNSMSSRYAIEAVNGVSQLITLERLVSAPALNALTAATSTSAALPDVGTLIDLNHNEFQISANGLAPLKIVIAPGDVAGASASLRLASLCAAIQAKVQALANGRPAYAAFTAAPAGASIALTSGAGGEFSSVRILPGERNNASGVLRLGAESGGAEIDGVAAIRPAPVPAPATLSSGAFAAADLDALPDATHSALRISLDGFSDLVDIGPALAVGATLADKLADVARRLQTAVRALKPGMPAYRYFTATVSTAGGNTRVVLATGTRGSGSTISVMPAAANSVAAELHLTSGTVTTSPVNVSLQSGTEVQFGSADVYTAFIGSRAERKGIYALEQVDLFNLLVLPGIDDPGVLADANAYCRERRAFFIIDAPKGIKSPDEAVQLITGTDLPKSDHAGVYYPWVYIADPLRNGKPRLSAPSGTVAGLFARTDADRGVWKAPAGTEASLVGVQALAYQMTDSQNGTLNPLGMNSLRVFPVHGAVCWGARTLRGADQMTSEYKYVPVRRLALFLEESLYRGTQWIVFEPNDEPLWAQIRLNLGAFMNGLFRQGAFQGKTPREAYLVKCDRETTTQDDINHGIVNILVAFAPLKPAEFVVIRIQQLAGQIQT